MTSYRVVDTCSKFLICSGWDNKKSFIKYIELAFISNFGNVSRLFALLCLNSFKLDIYKIVK